MASEEQQLKPEKGRRSPIAGVIDSFKRQWQDYAAQLIPKIKILIDKGKTVNQAVNQVFKEENVRQKFKEMLTVTITTSAEKGLKEEVKAKSFQRFYLNQHYQNDDLTLSQRISRLEFKRLVIDTIQTEMRNSNRIRRIAQSLTNKQLIEGDIAKYIENLEQAARRVIADPEDLRAFKEYQKQLRGAERQIQKLAEAQAPNQRLQRAYQNLIEKTKQFSQQELDKAVERAIKAKARYNAERIARTEAARAYGQASFDSFLEDDRIIAYRSELSSRHNVIDICDFYANADLYGMGPGVYPKEEGPPFPYHPHCMCILRPLRLSQIDSDQVKQKFQKQGGKEYFQKLVNEQPLRARRMLGQKGFDQFRRNPNSWDKNLGMYQKPEKKEKSIPDRAIESE